MCNESAYMVKLVFEKCNDKVISHSPVYVEQQETESTALMHAFELPDIVLHRREKMASN